MQLAKEKKFKFKKFEFKKIVPGILLMLAGCFMLFLYAPLELYFNNKNEFWFDFYNLMPVLLLMFAGAFVVGTLLLTVLYCISEKVYQVCLAAGFILYIATYIQGNFLIKNLPPLDGTQIDWSQYSAERIKCMIMWGVVITAVLVLLKFIRMEKFAGVVKTVSIGMTLMLAVTIVTVAIQNRGLEKKEYRFITNKNIYEMSEDTNLVVLVLDAVDARMLTDMMETHPQYEETFADFTYYPNTLSAYPYTRLSIPFILSGEWYENEQSLEAYSTGVYKDGQLFADLEQQGYKMGLYETEVLSEDDSVYRFENIVFSSGKISSYRAFMKAELQLVGMKYAPFDLKRFCVFDTNWFYGMQEPVEGAEQFAFENWHFYDTLSRIPVTYTDEKCFKFIHTEGAHEPFRYDADVNFADVATYETNVEAAMTVAGTYINKLKEAGVYDNTAIVIMADHGYSDPTIGLQGRQNPMLMVKGINEKHEMKISEAPISFDDLQEAYSRLLEGATDEEIFDAREGDVRERRFLYYEYLAENYLEEYYTQGDAGDEDSLIPSGRVYGE